MTKRVTVDVETQMLDRADVDDHPLFAAAPLTAIGRRFLLRSGRLAYAHEVKRIVENDASVLVLKLWQVPAEAVLSTSPRRVVADIETGHVILMVGAVVETRYGVSWMRRHLADLLITRPYDHLHAPEVARRFDVKRFLRVSLQAAVPEVVEDALNDVRL